MRRFLIRLIVATVLSGSRVTAQGPEVELFGGGSWWAPAQDSVYDATYIPGRVSGIDTLFEDPDPRSLARQSLVVAPGSALAAGAGVNVISRAGWGVQVLVDRATLDLGGANAPHEVALTYTTLDFPSPDPVVRSLDFSFPVRETTGRWRERVLSVNVVARAVRAGPLTARVSGGVSSFRLAGSAAPIGAFAAWLGGHAVLFSELYEFGVVVPPAHGVGFNLGGDVALPLGDRLAVFGDLRVFDGGPLETKVIFDELRSRNVVEPPLTRIEAFFDLDPLRLDPGFTRVLVGLRWRAW